MARERDFVAHSVLKADFMGISLWTLPLVPIGRQAWGQEEQGGSCDIDGRLPFMLPCPSALIVREAPVEGGGAKR